MFAKLLLEQLGLDKNEVKVITALLECGELSALGIARHSGVNRVSVYRVLDRLVKDGYVLNSPAEKPARFSPPSLQFFEEQVEQQREHVQQLGLSYVSALPDLEQLYGKRASDIKVFHFNGRDQARELCWNSLKAKTPVKSFGHRSLRESLGYDFLVRWWNEIAHRQIRTYLLANPETFRMKSDPGPESKEKFAPNGAWYHRRFFLEKDFKIINETFIYDNVFAVLHWDDKQIFGVEIHHPEIARQQEYVFDLLWKQAKVYPG